eukprot:CAMPEP_0181314934 /NCGR_PEP_ID=MMETSP1101-20121128/15092_1 /TAXON_ID=46948 /ORGANISM="Rhodomonas abbreviata, Strain Caron Lab Isolate" /LENGTH=105 /DNA_ID=CAMNT_0023422079 /DNA_START=17 /DNA_END=334 /DNA_ORIENTATION=+
MSLQERIEAVIAIEDKEERKAARKELVQSLDKSEHKEAKAIFASLKDKSKERRKKKKGEGKGPSLSKEERQARRAAKKEKREAAAAAGEESPLDDESSGTDTEDE